MTIIDHRILIPAAPDVVWDYISDITHNPDWQVDCADVIFLTSRREGPGVRWRYASPNGHEYVVAVTAWYNGLGYEYYLVDGAPYRENKGRIRLQEIPEGTIVQWTFTYELGGLLGGMRNTLGVNRQVDGTIAESLKTLWQKIKESGAASRPHEAKSLMRDAPNVDARSAYQPRHPSHSDRPETQKAVPTAPTAPTAPVPAAPAPIPTPIAASKFQAEPPVREGDGQPISIINEPPIKQEDTKPRPAVTLTPEPAAEPAVPADLEGEPDFLEAVDLSRFEPPRDPSDTQPRKPVAPPAPVEPVTAAEPEPPPEVEARFAPPRTPAPPPQVGEETEPLPVPQPEILPAYRAPVIEAPKPESEAEREPELASAVEIVEESKPQPKIEPEPTPEPPVAVEPISEVTAPVTEQKQEKPSVAEPESAVPSEQPETKPEGEHASIWEIFGVPRPSETQETAVIKTEPIVEAVIAEPIAVAVSSAEKALLPRGSSYIGLRIVLRRKLARVRRP